MREVKLDRRRSGTKECKVTKAKLARLDPKDQPVPAARLTDWSNRPSWAPGNDR